MGENKRLFFISFYQYGCIISLSHYGVNLVGIGAPPFFFFLLKMYCICIPINIGTVFDKKYHFHSFYIPTS